MQKIIPNLWFDTEAEEAANFYVSVFGDGSRVLDVTHYGPNQPREEGLVLTVDFELRGQRFTAINGGPEFPFTEAVSLLVNCEDQAEIDHFWDALVEGGEPGPCGWLKDRYGLSWQIAPAEADRWIKDPDKEKVNRYMQEMLKTQGKFDLEKLRAAFEGQPQRVG